MKRIVGGLVAVGLIATAISSYALKGGSSASPVVQGEPGAEAPAAQAGGGRKIKGTASPQVKRYDDVRGLVADSQHVIVGVPVYQASHVSSKSEEFVWTDYRVKVLSVLKGGTTPGQIISVRTEGGKLALPDGTEVETQVPATWKSPSMRQGHVMFLSKKSDKSPYFRLTGGPQGLFLISPWTNSGTTDPSLGKHQVVVPQARPSDALTKTYGRMSADTFLNTLRRAVAADAEGR